MKKSFRLFWAVFFFFGVFQLSAQNLPVGFPALEDYYRRAQLLGEIDSTFSFTARPFNPVATLNIANPFDPDGSLAKNRMTNWDGTARFLNNKWMVMVLPQSIQIAYKRPAPISINDGPMIPAKGFQTLYSGGIFTKIGPLSITFQPEIIFAENKDKWTFPEEHSNESWIAYYRTYAYIDLPEQFGTDPYQRYTLGQTRISLDFGPISFGFSNQNLWWGPGYRNSLLMTNSAPGFKHLTVNTTKPIKTYIGNFEGQIVGGRLEASGFQTPHLDRDGIGNRYNIPKPDDWRYFNGMVLTYMPKWTPGLSFGMARSFMRYSAGLDTFGEYFPLFAPLFEGHRAEVANDHADQYLSVFGRWLFNKEHAEVYFEWGREDRSADLRDLYLDLTHSRAYILGLRKLFDLPQKNQYVEFLFEMTTLESRLTDRWSNYTKYVQSWYKHGQIRHGYTHYGQMLGAGIGPGSNLQTVGVSWVNGIKKVGVQIERYVHNMDFRHNAPLDVRSNWVDFIVSFPGYWDYKNFIFNAQIDLVKTHNYYWYYNPWENLRNVIRGTTEAYWAHGRDVYTIQALLGVTYRF